MLLAGDESGRTQHGNNNSYCQDDEISWLNWELQEKGSRLPHFVKRLNDLRHRYSILRRDRFLTGEFVEERGARTSRGSMRTALRWKTNNGVILECVASECS
jgi:isoamylase